MTNRCPHHDDVGPWVLGALGEDDARAFRDHLAACEACSADVAELAPVVDLLPAAAPQVVPPPVLERRPMAAVESEARVVAAPRAARSRRLRLAVPGGLRLAPALALACLCVAVGLAAGSLLFGGDGATVRNGFGPRGAQVALTVTDGHGRLDVRDMPAPPAGRVYQVWLVRGDAPPRPTHALFTVARDGRARVDIMESLRGVDRVLVTVEPPAGSSAPTTQPVAGAALR